MGAAHQKAMLFVWLSAPKTGGQYRVFLVGALAWPRKRREKR